jgi:hypothetical protein
VNSEIVDSEITGYSNRSRDGVGYIVQLEIEKDLGTT